jgi:hypothetical protein
MANFLSSRGCIYKYTPADGAGKGFYDLQQLRANVPDCLLVGVDLNDVDIVSPVATLDGKRILYTFGQGFGDVRISGELLLGPAGSQGAANIGKLVKWFNAARVSQLKRGISLSVGSSGYKVYVQQMSIAQMDPELHVQPFGIVAMIADPPT